MMISVIKNVGLLLFSAGDEIERKAEEFKKIRRERYKNMEDVLGNGKNDFLGKLGVASESQIDELKDQIEELSSKMDTLIKKSDS